MGKTSNSSYEVKVEDGITHIISPDKNGVIHDVALTPGESVTINIKNSQIILDVPHNLNGDTTFMIVGNGNDDWKSGTYGDLARIKTDADRLYAYPVGGQTLTTGYDKVEKLINAIAEANEIEDPYTVPFGFSGSGIHAYTTAKSNDNIVCCVECDPASSRNDLSYKSDGSTYTIILGKNTCNDVKQRMTKSGTSEYKKAKNVLFIGAARSYHDEFQNDMGKLGITDFVDTKLDIVELKEKLTDYYGEKKWTMILMDSEGNIIENPSDEQVQGFLDNAYEAIEERKGIVNSPNTGELSDQEKELLSKIKNISTLKTSDKYEEGAISTKYQSVVNGINDVLLSIKSSFVNTKNPKFNNNQALNGKVCGVFNCLSNTANGMLLDTKDVSNAFGYLLQDYSYLENKLNMDVNDIAELDGSSLISSGGVTGYNPSQMSYEEFKIANLYEETVVDGKVGSLSLTELSGLLSDKGIINSYFGNEIDSSKTLIEKIQNLYDSESQGPGWDEAKKYLVDLKYNYETRIRTAEYLQGQMTAIFTRLKNYIEPDESISDERLPEIIGQINKLNIEIPELSRKIASMPDYVMVYDDTVDNWIQAENSAKAYLQAVLASKIAVRNALVKERNRIEGYCELVRKSIAEMNSLMEEVSTSSSYYGGLRNIPQINIQGLENLN